MCRLNSKGEVEVHHALWTMCDICSKLGPNITMSTVFLKVVTVLTQAHNFAISYEAGAQLGVVVLLQHHQHTDNLSCDEGVIKALLGHRLQRESAVHLHCSLRV